MLQELRRGAISVPPGSRDYSYTRYALIQG